MIKVRDLGINFIPNTMQPPEIGGGGGGPDTADSTCGTCTNCTGDTCKGSPACEPHSGGHKPPGCAGTPNCGKHSHKNKQQVGGLTHEVVAQLKAQLQNHIGSELAS